MTPLDTNKGVKTLPEILDEFQAQVEDGYAGPVNGWTTLKQEAQAAIAKELMGCLPEKKEHHEFECKYGTYENFHTDINCPNAKEERVHNQTVDEVRARLTAFIGKEK